MSENRYATPQEAEDAFYAAFIKRDVHAMMSVWAEDEDIACIHPLSPMTTGVAAVRASWESIFRHSPPMKFMINEKSRLEDSKLAVHIVEEHIHVNNEPARPPVLATHVYRLTDNGWRMILHHASPSPKSSKQEKQTLH